MMRDVQASWWKLFCGFILIALGFLTLTTVARAQASDVTIQLIDGKDGKPFAKHRLLVFTGVTARDAQLHKGNLVVMTDEAGVATLANISADVRWIQVLPDWLTLCQPEIRPNTYALEELATTGARTANNCSGLTKDLVAGRLIVFARPMTFSEKMRR